MRSASDCEWWPLLFPPSLRYCNWVAVVVEDWLLIVQAKRGLVTQAVAEEASSSGNAERAKNRWDAVMVRLFLVAKIANNDYKMMDDDNSK